MSRNLVFYAGLVWCLLGCGEIRQKFGRQGGQTEVNFALSGDSPSIYSTLPGGILVYIVGVSGTDFTTNLKFDDETQSKSISLPNGAYKVFAVGWASSGSPNYYPVEGQAYCGFGSSGGVITLSGGSSSIPIAMSTGNCSFTSASAFANSGQTASSNFGQLAVQFCSGITGTPSCSTADTTYGGKYLRMSFDIYVKKGGSHAKIGESEFGCAFINTNDASTSKIVPPGGSASGDPRIFALSFSIHTDSSCTSSPVASFSAPNGLDNDGATGVVSSDFNTVSNISTYYVDL